jgi:4-hydroxybenzoate polyprenyltransferase
MKGLLKLLRLKQYHKNLFVFAPLIFSRHLFDWFSFVSVSIGFLLFCLASSALYIFNDVMDIESDRQHPQKRLRPLPSGEVSAGSAISASAVLGGVSLLSSFFLGAEFGLTVLIYMIINVCYSIILKHLVILDVMVIAAGFVLRVLAGAVIVNVHPSEWLIICTTLLSLFLGFSKRRHELVILGDDSVLHRKVLEHYSPYFLDQMISVVTAATIMSYLLYTVSDRTVAFFGTRQLIWTVPFVLYGIFRYLYLVHQKEEGSDPAELMLKDRPLSIDVVLWAASCVLIIYFVK